MRRLALFRRSILTRVGIVGRLHLRGIDLDARRQRVGRQRHVFDLRLLGRLVRFRVLLVIRLDLRVIDLDRLHERFGIDRRDRDFALLLEQREIAFRRRARDDVAVDEGLLQRLKNQLAAHALLERQRRHALRLQHLLVALGREFAVDLKRLLLRNEFIELRVGDAEPAGAGAVFQQALVDELIDERVARFRCIEDRRIVVASERLAHPILLVAHHLVEVGLSHLVVADGGDGIASAAAAKVVIHAEESERQRDQRENHLDDALVLENEVVHFEFVR